MDIQIYVIITIAFTAVSGAVFVLGQYFDSKRQMRRRLPVAGSSAVLNQGPPSTFSALVSQHFTEERYGVDGAFKQKLKLQLMRSGFFSPLALRYYVFSRLCTVIVLPGMAFLVGRVFAPDMSPVLNFVMLSVAAGVGVLGPDSYLSRRQNSLVAEYRLIFPDLLDLLMVCISAGLSVEASFEKVRDHLFVRSPAFARNIELMGAEMRAGRSTVEALSSMADRLALDEARSLVAMLRQSVELGGDIGTSLRIFSETMRSKRMLLAEKKANELPVKIVLPMAMGIFPVIMLIVLLPVLLKLVKIMHTN
jgi:tight adherence protein C